MEHGWKKIIDSEDLDMNNDRTYAVGSRNMKTSVIMKIIFGSILGIFIFMTPMPWQGELTIPLWIIKNLLS